MNLLATKMGGSFGMMACDRSPKPFPVLVIKVCKQESALSTRIFIPINHQHLKIFGIYLALMLLSVLVV